MRRTLSLLLLTLIGVAVLTVFSPAEKSLGVNVRVVYLHGAWVWAAILTFAVSALAGLLAFFTRRSYLHRWSMAFGRTGIIFWLSYLPLSAWASELNWNGLFMAEPRWRVAFIFAVTGLLLQGGLALINRPALYSLANTIYFVLLAAALSTARQIMHPPSPIFSSASIRIQLYFLALVALSMLVALQISVWWVRQNLRTRVTLAIEPPAEPQPDHIISAV